MMPDALTENSGGAKTRPRTGLFESIPASVWVIAVLAALLHMAPFWRAQSQTPAGWAFTGNLYHWPGDEMQYSSWFRQSQRTGILVSNNFTSEPNSPHLPVVLYYAVGKIGRWINRPPEVVNLYLGSFFALVLTILLFATVRHFLRVRYRVWWVFGLILVGGGLGAYVKLLGHAVMPSPLLKRIVDRCLRSVHIPEIYRDYYVFATLFDTHYLLVWMLTASAVLSLYFLLRRFSAGRLLPTALLYSATTLVHVYEGPLLILITTGVALLCWRKRLLDRRKLVAIGACVLAAAMTLGGLAGLLRASGLPLTSFNQGAVSPLFLLVAYPIACLLIPFGLGQYWRKAGLEGCFLLGWALGCIAHLFSGQFYPYAIRGTMTLQIPLYITAGAMYFSGRSRVGFRQVVIVA